MREPLKIFCKIDNHEKRISAFKTDLDTQIRINSFEIEFENIRADGERFLSEKIRGAIDRDLTINCNGYNFCNALSSHSECEYVRTCAQVCDRQLFRFCWEMSMKMTH